MVTMRRLTRRTISTDLDLRRTSHQEYLTHLTPGTGVISFVLSNSSPKSKVQTSVLGLGVDFVFPLSQQQEEQEEEPSPKHTGSNGTRGL